MALLAPFKSASMSGSGGKRPEIRSAIVCHKCYCDLLAYVIEGFNSLEDNAKIRITACGDRAVDRVALAC